ncbi:MAG: extracellular solute-binding protein [Chloroflexia bacterium]|nr:extracellular solute-binding protein [Chloroflexia bacterium]
MAFDTTHGSTKRQRHRIARRDVLKAGLGSGMALAATRGQMPGVGGASAASQAEPVALTYLHHEHPPVNTLEEELIQQFQQENPNITIEYLVTPDVDMFTEYSAMLVAGAPPDIVNFGDTDVPAVWQRGQLAPVDLSAVGVASMEEMESRYIPNALSGYIFDGQLYALPSELSDYVMWVNTQMLETAGVEYPRTWEEMSTIGQELMIRDSGQVTQEAIALPFSFPGAQFLVLDAMARQAGGQLFSDDGTESFLTSDPVVKAVTTLANLVQVDKITDPALNGTTAGADRDLFLNGVAAMMLTGGSWYQGNLEGTEVGEYAIPVPYPRFEGGPDVAGDVYGYGLTVGASSQHPAEAWKFVGFLAAHGTDYFEAGGLFIGDKETAEGDVAAEFPNWDTFQAELAAGQYAPRLYQSNEISDIVGRTLDAVVRSNEEPMAALEAAQSRVTSLLNS